MLINTHSIPKRINAHSNERSQRKLRIDQKSREDAEGGERGR